MRVVTIGRIRQTHFVESLLIGKIARRFPDVAYDGAQG